MPVGVTMLVRLNQEPEDSLLQTLRIQFQHDLELTEEDFYNSRFSRGPLVNVEEGDLPFMPVLDEKSAWLNVNLHRSYYGLGYERGDIRLFVRCAEWLEQHLRGCEVYYGNDVDDENVHLFDKTTRETFMSYYREVGTEPYHNKDEERSKQLRALWRE